MSVPIELVRRGFVDIYDAVREIETQPDVWNRYDARLVKDGPHEHVSDIWVRYNAVEKLGTPAFAEPHTAVWYPVVQQIPAVYQIVMKLVRELGALQLGGVLVTRIPAGKECKPHIDRGWHAGFYEKFAVQLASAPGQAFCFDDARLSAEPGDLYWFRNDVKHWVVNPTTEDRMTLIICLRVKPDWRETFKEEN